MKQLTPDVDPEAFFSQLERNPQSSLLLLDYDGTLAPFQADRNSAKPYPGVRNLIKSILSESAGRVAIVTGRAIGDLLPLIGLDRPPEVWGAHGREHLSAGGERTQQPVAPASRRKLDEARRLAEEAGLEDHCEEKPGCLALHWRSLEPDTRRETMERFTRVWGELAESDLSLHEFDGGIELRTPGRTKGDAVRTLLSTMQTVGAVAYLGDDLTDEDAFRALSGCGLRVLVRAELRPTEADLWIQPPEELLDFLTRWLDCARTRTLQEKPS